jgi:hypothetical protein
MSMGLAAGYPMDAVITAKFRKRGLCNQAEGERLLAFTNTADPVLTRLMGPPGACRMTRGPIRQFHHSIVTRVTDLSRSPQQPQCHLVFFSRRHLTADFARARLVFYDDGTKLTTASHGATLPSKSMCVAPPPSQLSVP